MTSLRLYGIPLSQPFRAVQWMLDGHDVGYDLKSIMPGSKQSNGTKSKDFVKKFPNATIPALEDSERRVVITESHAILIYLAEKYQWHDVYPGYDIRLRTKINEYLHWHHRNTREITLTLFAPLMRKDLSFDTDTVKKVENM